MVWLVVVTSVLTLAVLLVAGLALRLRRRIDELEHRLAAVPDSPMAPLDEPGPGFVITELGEAVEPEPVSPPPVEPRLFADLLLREGVVQAAALVHGVRRALAPETRNRIRFEMRREVKRSRKQRRADLREARRDWEARQRAEYAAAEDTAA